jgi:hypothetical protein
LAGSQQPLSSDGNVDLEQHRKDNSSSAVLEAESATTVQPWEEVKRRNLEDEILKRVETDVFCPVHS